MQVNNKAAHDAGYVFDTYMGEGYGSSQNSTIYPVAALSPTNGIGVANATFQASISYSTLNVTSISAGLISIGMTIVDSSSTSYGIITAFGSGNGGIGSYTITGYYELGVSGRSMTGTLQVSVNTTLNSPIVIVSILNSYALAAALAKLSVGQLVKYSSGAGSSSTFPSGTAIIKIEGTTITLSQNATTTSSNVFITIGYSLPLLITDQFPTSSSRLNDFKPILMLQREGTGNEAYAAAAAISLSRYEVSGVNSRTRLDISLAHGAFTDVVKNTIMTIQSNGFVGIGSNIQRLGGLSSGPNGYSYDPWTTLAVTRTTTQDDRYGIIHATTNIGSTISSSNASITAANYYSTAQLMAFSSTGTKIGTGKTNGTGHLWITYANSVTGLYIHGSTTGSLNDSNGGYYKAGWIAISAGTDVLPNGPLHIYEPTGTAASPHYGTLVLEHGNTGGASSIVFKSKNNNGSDYGYIQYQDDSTVAGTGEKARLIIGVQNDTRPNTTTANTIADDIVLSASGAIVGTGSGVAGLFAPRVSIPAQSFVAASEGSNGENSPPAFSYWVPGSTYGNSLTRGGWNRFELKYAPDSIMSADATIHLPQNFSPNAVITFKILWYRDPGTTLLANNSNKGVVWKVSVIASTPLRKQSNATYSNNGDNGQARSNNANATLTALNNVVDAAPNDTLGEFSYVESIVTWAPTSSNAPIAYPGDILGVRLTRLATDTEDTYAGTVVFNNMVVEFGAIAPDGMSG